MIALPLLTRRRRCVTSGYQMLPLKLPAKSLKYNSVTCVTSVFPIREKVEDKVKDYALIINTQTSAASTSAPTCKKQVTQVTCNQISELAGNAKGNIKVTEGDTSYACDQPNKISAVPLVNPKSLQDVFASRVPALVCGWENLLCYSALQPSGGSKQRPTSAISFGPTPTDEIIAISFDIGLNGIRAISPAAFAASYSASFLLYSAIAASSSYSLCAFSAAAFFFLYAAQSFLFCAMSSSSCFLHAAYSSDFCQSIRLYTGSSAVDAHPASNKPKAKNFIFIYSLQSQRETSFADKGTSDNPADTDCSHRKFPLVTEDLLGGVGEICMRNCMLKMLFMVTLTISYRTKLIGYLHEFR